MMNVTKWFWLFTSMVVLVAFNSVALVQYGQNTNNQNRDRHKSDQNGSQDRTDQNRNEQNRQDHSKFDDHDQQVTRDWYKQHHNDAPVGLRDRDRLSSEEESRLRPGSTLDSRLRTKAH